MQKKRPNTRKREIYITSFVYLYILTVRYRTRGIPEVEGGSPIEL